VHGAHAIQTALLSKENKITALSNSARQPSVSRCIKAMRSIILDDGQWFNIGSRSEYLKVHRIISKERCDPSAFFV
jgi:hypothetical protein